MDDGADVMTERLVLRMRTNSSSNGVTKGRGGSCRRAQQTNGGKTASPKVLTLTNPKVSKTRFAKRAKSRLSLLHCTAFTVHLGSVRPSPPPKKNSGGRGGAHFTASTPGAEIRRYDTRWYFSVHTLVSLIYRTEPKTQK